MVVRAQIATPVDHVVRDVGVVLDVRDEAVEQLWRDEELEVRLTNVRSDLYHCVDTFRKQTF